MYDRIDDDDVLVLQDRDFALGQEGTFTIAQALDHVDAITTVVHSPEDESSSSDEESQDEQEEAVTPTGGRSHYSFNTCVEGDTFSARRAEHSERPQSLRRQTTEHVYDDVAPADFRARSGAISRHQPRGQLPPPLPQQPPPVQRLQAYTTWSGRVAPPVRDVNINVHVSLTSPEPSRSRRSRQTSDSGSGPNPLLDTTQTHGDTARIVWRRLRSDMGKLASSAADFIRRRPL